MALVPLRQWVLPRCFANRRHLQELDAAKEEEAAPLSREQALQASWGGWCCAGGALRLVGCKAGAVWEERGATCMRRSWGGGRGRLHEAQLGRRAGHLRWVPGQNLRL